jgi:hypothetical protein
MRVQLTVRVEPHTADYVARLAGEATRQSGIRVSVSEIGAALLERAEAEGWQVAPGKLQTIRPDQTGG